MARPEVIFFDVNETLLDLTPLKRGVAEALGGRPELAPLWFTTLLQYSLVATVADRYRNFDEIGAACLRLVAESQGVELGEGAAERCLAPMRSLPPHPDVIPALERLRDAGFRLAALTNSSQAAVAEQMGHSGLAGFFEAVLSVEEVGLYKPHAHVYRWAARRAGADVSRCLLVAAHGWDVAGASWAGMRAAFIARPGQPIFPLGPAIDLALPSFEGLPDALAEWGSPGSARGPGPSRPRVIEEPSVGSAAARPGATPIRKQVIGSRPQPAPAPSPGEIDVAAVATVLVTSEDPEHPVEHAFDRRRGPGGSRWVAGEPGEQTLILAFDSPQSIRRVILEVEEPEVARTQDLQLAVSTDGGRSYRELRRQGYTFSPPGTTFEREDWAVVAEGVTHLRLVIRTDQGGKPCRASVTALVLH